MGILNILNSKKRTHHVNLRNVKVSQEIVLNEKVKWILDVLDLAANSHEPIVSLAIDGNFVKLCGIGWDRYLKEMPLLIILKRSSWWIGLKGVEDAMITHRKIVIKYSGRLFEFSFKNKIKKTDTEQSEACS